MFEFYNPGYKYIRNELESKLPQKKVGISGFRHSIAFARASLKNNLSYIAILAIMAITKIIFPSIAYIKGV